MNATAALLKGEVERLHLDLRETAQALGMSYGTLGHRLNGFAAWKPSEIARLMKVLSTERQRQAIALDKLRSLGGAR